MQNDDQIWLAPPHPSHLGENDVHVWRAPLEVSADRLAQLRLLLIDEEVERAGRFYFAEHRHRWTVARATLRMLLGTYLAVEPTSLRFVNNEHGKPAILSPDVGQRLHFNLSHSGDLALYAFAYNRALGVDVEQMRSNVEYNDLATHFFSALECAALRTLPAERQEEAFFLCWSRKEAYIKARGKGLAIPLDQFDVTLVPGEPAQLLGSREEPSIAERWSLHALAPGARYAGALVVEGFDWTLSCFNMEDNA